MESSNYTQGGKLINSFMKQDKTFIPITNGLARISYRDWNSLMPVINKIKEEELYRDYVDYTSSMFAEGGLEINTKLFEVTYNSVIHFIKWFNKPM